MMIYNFMILFCLKGLFFLFVLPLSCTFYIFLEVVSSGFYWLQGGRGPCSVILFLSLDTSGSVAFHTWNLSDWPCLHFVCWFPACAQSVSGGRVVGYPWPFLKVRGVWLPVFPVLVVWGGSRRIVQIWWIVRSGFYFSNWVNVLYNAYIYHTRILTHTSRLNSNEGDRELMFDHVWKVLWGGLL